MLISMNWINDFVDLSGLDLEKLIHQFTLSTAEVEDIYYMGRDIKDVVVARIVSIENHPEDVYKRQAYSSQHARCIRASPAR